MEEMTRKVLPAMAGWATVAAITEEWVAGSGHVQPNLVGAPCMGGRLNQCSGSATDRELQAGMSPANAPTTHREELTNLLEWVEAPAATCSSPVATQQIELLPLW